MYEFVQFLKVIAYQTIIIFVVYLCAKSFIKGLHKLQCFEEGYMKYFYFVIIFPTILLPINYLFDNFIY